ncbi:MAG: glycosyltransferase family 4 protein [Magnetococcales bacterium]|nr:glycosyltransferase family 4 protein [Magnetococcales bacterium]
MPIPPPPRPLTVLMVYATAYPDIRGGIDTLIHTLTDHWSRTGPCRVVIFAPASWDQPGWTREQRGPVTIYRARLRLPRDRRRPLRGLLGWLREAPGLFWRLRRMIQAEGVEVIHLHTLQGWQDYFRLLRRWGGPPYLITLHGSDALKFHLKPPREARALARIWRGADARTGVSPQVVQRAGEIAPELPPPRLIVNGVPLETSEPPHPVAGIPPEFALVVGWISPVKGQEIVIRAWALAHGVPPGLHLVLAGKVIDDDRGQPPEFTAYKRHVEEVRALIHREGLEGRVHLLGEQPHAAVRWLMQRATVILFPSRSEGTPFTLLEAGALAKPVIASRIPAFEATLDPQREGWLVPTEEPAAWAEIIQQALDHPGETARRGAALREKIARDHAVQTMADAYLALYQRLARPSPPP